MLTFIRKQISDWRTPYQRYQHQRAVHSLRLALAVIIAIFVGQMLKLDHSEWIAITVFVILGTVPYQGSITSKSFERIAGTVLGMCVGLGLLWLNQNYLHHNILFYLAVATVSWICGWKALGKRGYTAMLVGLTMSMLLGHSGTGNWVHDGIMRAVNVIIGAGIGSSLSLLIPIKSTLMWRFMLADNMSTAAKMLGDITGSKSLTAEQLSTLAAEQQQLSARLVKTRSLLAATAHESKIPLGMLDNIQQSHRSIVSSINLMLTSVPKLPKPRLNSEEEQLLKDHFFSLQHDLRLITLLLKGEWRPHISIHFDDEESVRTLAHKLPFETQGFIWVSLNIRAELFTLLTLLQYHRKQWLTLIERNHLNE